MTIQVLAAALMVVSVEGADTPLTLTTALEEAGRNNPDLQLLRAASELAELDVDAAWSTVMPRLDVFATFGRRVVGARQDEEVIPLIDYTTNPPTVTGYERKIVPTDAADFGDYSLGLSLSQPIFEGMRSTNALTRARAEVRAAAHALREATLSAAFGVTRAFYEVIRAQRTLQVLGETAQQSTEDVERADALHAAGRVGKDATLSARVNLGADRIRVAQQRAVLAQARAQLSVALGRAADTGLDVVVPAVLDASLPPEDAMPPPLEALRQVANESRGALLQQNESIEIAAIDVKRAREPYFPTLDAGISYSRTGPDLAGARSVYSDLSKQYVMSAQLSVRWNLFAGLSTMTAAQQATVQHRRARVTADRLEQEISAELVRARSNVVAHGRTARLAQENQGVAEEALLLARQRYDAGAASQLEMRDASLKLTEAKLSYVSSRIDFVLAMADLNRAAGGSWAGVQP